MLGGQYNQRWEARALDKWLSFLQPRERGQGRLMLARSCLAPDGGRGEGWESAGHHSPSPPRCPPSCLLQPRLRHVGN